MRKPIYVIGHTNPDTDSICSAISYAHFLRERHKHNVIAARIGPINDETKFVLKYFNVPPPVLIKNGAGKNLIILDHNEISLSIQDVRKANILEIIDHHRIGDVETIHPIPFENEPRGSCASIIADRFGWFRIPISRKISGMMLSALLSDTILLNSPTTTRKDRQLARKLARVAKVDINKYGRRMLEAGCDVIKHSPRKILYSDFKTYGEGDNKIGIGQVNVTNSKEALWRRKEIMKEMKKTMKKGFKFVFLMLTNIITLKTDLICTGEGEAIEKAFKKKMHNNTIVLKKTVSRKRQVQPKALELLKWKQ